MSAVDERTGFKTALAGAGSSGDDGAVETVDYRHLDEPERHLLPDFLYLAVHVPDGASPPPPEIVRTDPALRCYVDSFGTRRGDLAVCAVVAGRPVAVAWCRILGGDSPGYGHVDDDTPEIAVAVLPEHRGAGIGTTVLTYLFDELSHLGWTQVSLSVDKDNRARHLYERLGFRTVKDNPTDLVMLRPLGGPDEVSTSAPPGSAKDQT